MVVLGINAFEENPSACLVMDGKLVAFCEEERLIRLKGAYGHFPNRAVEWCLTSNNLALGDVGRIAVSWDCLKYPKKMMWHLCKTRMKYARRPFYAASSIPYRDSAFSAFETLYLHCPSTFSRKIRDNLRASGHVGPIPEISFISHHLSHAYQTYFQSPFRNASVLVVDGSGEENCVSGYCVMDGNFKKVLEYDIPQSLGWFYSGFTGYFGFRPSMEEGKLMGLSAFGKVRSAQNPWLERLDRILKVSQGGYEIDPYFFKFGGNESHGRFTDELARYITSFNPRLTPIGRLDIMNNAGSREQGLRYLDPDYVDLAWAVQARMEEALAALAKRLIAMTGLRNLCLAGGVAMNCKANGVIAALSEVDDLFVHPASSDAGACIGAAFVEAERHGFPVRNILQNAQFGPSFANDIVKKTLAKFGLRHSIPSDIGEKTAELLSRKKIVGWFSGRMEMGPRALGARSIIAYPGDEIKQIVNTQVKYREWWRPYCPSMTEEASDAFIDCRHSNPFMIVACNAKPKLMDSAPGVVHVDNTVRPQVVRKEDLGRWHYLLGCVEKKCGHPLLLNTSFNVQGEPIVCSPSDAIRTFFASGLDALVLEDFLIEK
jgi:carbamoyltransferase